MYVRTEVISSIRRTKVGKRINVFVCDQCDIEYKRKYSICHIEKKVTFCSQACKKLAQRRGGIRYPTQLFTKKTREKAEKTYIERYGVPFSKIALNEGIRNKTQRTNFEKYGATSILKLEKSVVARRHCWKENHDKIIARRVETCMEKYGVPIAMQHESVKSKIDQVAHARKCHETMKRNKTYKKSRPEDMLYEALCSIYGNDDISRQVMLRKWCIDFYIKSTHVYVQLDGVYWHGLDRNIDEIAKFHNKRDKTIYETYMRDKEQNELANSGEIKLVRFTDVEIKSCKTLQDRIVHVKHKMHTKV